MKQIILLILINICLASCGDSEKNNEQGHNSGYVSPSLNYKGQFRKGNFRKSYSTDKNAYRNNARSRYYYQTRGKYMRKKGK